MFFLTHHFYSVLSSLVDSLIIQELYVTLYTKPDLLLMFLISHGAFLFPGQYIKTMKGACMK